MSNATSLSEESDTSVLSLASVLKPAYGPIRKTARAYWLENAIVSLERQGHSNKVILKVLGTFKAKFSLRWKPATQEMNDSYADEDEAAEYGAHAFAALL